MLIVFPPAPVALVLVYPEPSPTKSVDVKSAEMTWFNSTCDNTSVGTSAKLAKPLSLKKVAKAAFVEQVL